MRKTLPDEHGWYWAKSAEDYWYMAFVDTGEERVMLYDTDDYHPPECDVYPWGDDFPADLIVAWYGPLTCPGGDFGGPIIVASEEDHQKAEAEGKVIGIQHFDYRYCRDEGHGSSLSIYGLYDRAEADKRIHREVKEETP